MSRFDPIELPVLSREEAQIEAATRPTGFAEYLGAKVQQGFDYSLAGRLTESITSPPGAPLTSGTTIRQEERQADNPDQRRVTEGEWRKLRLDRPGLEFSGGGTVEYERARTAAFDERRYRDRLVERYQGGFAGQAVGFGAALLGSLPSPENFIPFVGEATRAAMVTRMGVIGGRTAAGAADAVIGTAIADAIVLPDLASRGEDVGAADFALDIALGAVIGSAFGAGGGVLQRRAETRFRQEQLSQAARAVRIDGIERQADAVELAMRAVAGDEPVDVGPVLSGADVAVRRRLLAGTAAPPEVSRPDVAGLPTALPVDRVRNVESLPVPTRPDGIEVVTNPSMGDVARLARADSGGITRLIFDGDGNLVRAFPGSDATHNEVALKTGLDKPPEPQRDSRNAIAEVRDGQVVVRPSVDRAASAVPLAQYVQERFKPLQPDTLAQALSQPGSSPRVTERNTAAASELTASEPSPPPVSTSRAGLPDPITPFVADYVRASPDPIHPSITEATATVTRPPAKTGVEEAQRLAADMGLDDPPELADIAVMKRDGLLTAADEASLERSAELVKEANGWATAYETLSTCVLRYGA